MTMNRRLFMAHAAAAGSITILPFSVDAEGHGGDVFDTPRGPVVVHPVSHASMVLQTPMGTIYVDPVGEAAAYDGLPAPDAILVTHQHGDHYNADLLTAIKAEGTPMITNPSVFDMLPDALKVNTTAMANGAAGEILGIAVDAIPAHNLTEDRMGFHPKGRDNGYVLSMDGFRIYISGDTEGVPEMRALKDIDLAFVCMNLPFTMDAQAAADVVREFAPSFVYPYHYRGRDGGTQDPKVFAELVGDAAEVRMGKWYGGDHSH